MRVLFTSPAGAGHVYPMVPTAQALRSAGHDVLFAALPPVGLLRTAGLPVVEVGDGSTLTDAFERTSRGPQTYRGEGLSHEERQERAARGFTEHCRTSVGGLLRLGERWRPDILVHEAFQAAGPLVAAVLRVPSVVHNFGVVSGRWMADRAARLMADEYRALGVTPGPAGQTVLDVVPASLGGDGSGWRVRYVPFNGGGTVPPWLLARGDRPRVAVTLGTVLTQWDGVRSIVRLMEQAATRDDAEFLLAVGDADLSPLGSLPPNVRPLPWVPLAQLLDACEAVVHHGGSGTMLTAAVAGIPQLILPQGADHFANADAAEARGFALRADDGAVDGELLDALLGDAGLRKAAVAMRREIAALPSPAELVADFEMLAAARRR